MEDDPLYHQGLLGTVIRFIPLFDYESNNTKTVIVSDIDHKKGVLAEFRKMYNLFIKSKSEFHFRTRDCYITIDRYKLVEKAIDLKYVPDIEFRIIASTIFSRMKFPKKIFEDFFECMKEINLERCQHVKTFVKIQNESLVARKDVHALAERLTLPYGIDEFFINSYVLKYLEDHRVPFSYSIWSGDLVILFYDVYLHRNKYQNVDEETINLFKEIIGKYYHNDQDFHSNYDFFDKILYKGSMLEKGEINEIREYFFKNIQRTFKKLKETNSYTKFGFSKEEIDCILKMEGTYPKWFIMHKYG